MYIYIPNITRGDTYLTFIYFTTTMSGSYKSVAGKNPGKRTGTAESKERELIVATSAHGTRARCTPSEEDDKKLTVHNCDCLVLYVM